VLRNIPSAIRTYLPTATDKTVPASGHHNYYTVFDFGVVTDAITDSILFHRMPKAGNSNSFKDKRDISQQSRK
jgi:hypothetical protein